MSCKVLHIFRVKLDAYARYFFEYNLMGLPPHEVVFKKVEQKIKMRRNSRYIVFCRRIFSGEGI